MIKTSELKITHSTVLSKNGKPFVAVSIERKTDLAEGCVPECKIMKNKGFSTQEVAELEQLLLENRQEIIEAAKGISKISYLLR